MCVHCRSNCFKNSLKRNPNNYIIERCLQVENRLTQIENRFDLKTILPTTCISSNTYIHCINLLRFLLGTIIDSEFRSNNNWSTNSSCVPLHDIESQITWFFSFGASSSWTVVRILADTTWVLFKWRNTLKRSIKSESRHSSL